MPLDESIGLALRIIDDVRDEVDRLTFRPGKSPLPDLSFDAARDSAKLGKEVRARIAALGEASLPRSVQLTLAVAAEHARVWSVREDWYWTVFDPLGSLFGMFAPTAYCGSFAISAVRGEMKRLSLAKEAERHRYLAAILELATMIDSFIERTRGQAERGIFMPRPQAISARDLLERLRNDLPEDLGISDARLPSHDDFKSEALRIARSGVGGKLAELRALLDDDYLAHAGDAVGLMHQPNGEAIYAELVKMHTATNHTPAELHEIGLAQMSEIRARMKSARLEAGFDGDDHAFRAHLDASADWREESPEAIQARFERYIERFRPHVARLFSILPKATYGVRPLPDSLTAAMTFGYYDGPKPDKTHGDYVFNARNLAKSGLFTLGALNYHELVPGHHFHLALQMENLALPALRKLSYPVSYTEGWAEYAGALAGEVGMYERPEERFGRLVSEAFLSCRIVVDTGMNALGWSLERAREYMRAHSFFPETEIRSETLRYSCDIPGQALAYKLGELELMRMRSRMQAALGARFELRDFHDAVLRLGALPLSVLAAEVERATSALLQK